MKVRIDRTKWYRGHDTGAALWVPSAQQGCCLGHMISKLYNIGIENLEEMKDPIDLYEANSQILTESNLFITRNNEGYSENSDFSNKCVDINDSTRISDNEREEKLKAICRGNGIILEFYN